MDPLLELSTLTVSYLWALRDVFPDAHRVEQIAIEDLKKRVYRSATAEGAEGVFDFALCMRFHDIADRENQERWRTQDETSRAHPQRSVDQWWNASSVDEAYRKQTPQFRPWHPLDSLAERWTQRLSDEEFCKLAENLLGDFTEHASYLIQVLGQQRLRKPGEERNGDEITRERLADFVHRDLLAEPSKRRGVAEALNYVPVLLRGFRTVDPERPTDTLHDLWDAVLSDIEYPRKLIAECKRGELAIPFSLVLHAELDEIDTVRQHRNQEARDVGNGPRRSTFERAFESNLLGLAFSGGGIRSATFNLGVLQALANKKWLSKVDYLSTVSGGGYIGAWLIAWIKRMGSIAAVQESLRGHALPAPIGEPTLFGPPAPARSETDPSAEHVRPIRLLREFSNYLTPRVGAFSSDSWTMIGIWLRNTALNLLVLTFFLMAVLLLPRLLGFVYLNADVARCVAATVACLACAAIFSGKNLKTFAPRVADSNQRGDTPFVVVVSIVVPMMFAAVFAAQAMWFAKYEAASGTSIFWWSVAIIFASLVLTTGMSYVRVPHSQRYSTVYEVVQVGAALARSVSASAAAAFAGAFAVAAIYTLVMPRLLDETRRGIWLDLAFGPLAILAVIGVVITIYLGIEGVHLPDERREWWSRLGAWLALIGIGWAIIATISYFSPYVAATLATTQAGTVGVGWSVLTAAGAWLAQSGKSNGINLPFDRNVITAAVIKASPFLFMAGFLIVLAIQTHALMLFLPRALNANELHTVLSPLPFALHRYTDVYWAFMDPDARWPAAIAAALFGLALLVAWRVDVNEFSMHHFYKNRLVRAYLGASRSRAQRRPNAFTGLDMQDDVKLWRFQSRDGSAPSDEWTNCRVGYGGPFPIINTTLNMTAGDELAWQERQGQSFVFTPLYCGYDFVRKQTVVSETLAAQFGFRPTKQFAGGPDDEADGGNRASVFAEARRAWYGDDSGIGLGTAVAISGAAANPNAGYHTSPGVAFLLTIFNARLGWWIGNPRFDKWRKPSPTTGLFYLLSELFGFSGVDRRFVQLSDGGHFDNMGLYELVRRRCRFIVVCDAEQDDRYSLNGLAGAIRKCRIDFGVIIDLPTDAIKKRKGGFSAAHTAVGTISYPDQHGDGHIVYIKASLTGDEPVDVLEYRSRHGEFPHQTTGDQFFDESQFESYRALGQHIVDCTFPEWGGELRHEETYESRLTSRLTSVGSVGRLA